MTISYFISVPSFKSTAFVVWILAKGGGGKFTPLPCFKATSEPPCTIGLIAEAAAVIPNGTKILFAKGIVDLLFYLTMNLKILQIELF